MRSQNGQACVSLLVAIPPSSEAIFQLQTTPQQARGQGFGDDDSEPTGADAPSCDLVGNRWIWLTAAAVGLPACSGVSDVNNVPAAADPAATPEAPAGASESAPHIAGDAPAGSSLGDTLWTTVEVIDGD